MLCGLWNGFLVAILDIQPIIATLILMVAGRGIALLIDEGLIVTFRSDFFSAISTGEFLTVPSRIIVCAGTLLFLWLLLRRTALGLFIESVGGNSAAADLAGINARLVKIGAYTLSGLCSGIAGVLICADIRGSDSNNAGLFIELDAILAVVIGGGSLAGGRFYLGLTIVGVLVIQGLTTSILVSGLPAQYNMIVKGVVVLIVLLLQSRRLRESIVGAVPEENVMRDRYLTAPRDDHRVRARLRRRRRQFQIFPVDARAGRPADRQRLHHHRGDRGRLSSSFPAASTSRSVR